MEKKRSSSDAVRRTSPRDKIKLPDAPKKGEKRSVGAAGSDAGEAGSPNDPYRLKVDAVEALVTASEENAPPVSPAELRRYGKKNRLRLPPWLTAILLKFWMGGVICYFFIWGLGSYGLNTLDHLVVVAVALGLITNLLTSNIFRFLAPVEGAFDRWMMFPKKGWYYLPMDILYAGVLVFCVVWTYWIINRLGAAWTGNETVLGVGPILFGVFVLAWDLLFLAMKHLLLRIVSDAKRKEGGNRP